MINGDIKGVNNRHVQFGSITSSGKGYNRHCILWLPHRKCVVKILIDGKYYVRHLNEKILIAGRAVLQVCQISRLCAIAFMGYY